MPVGGLYEVRVGTEVVYTDAKGDYLLKGDIIDLRSHENITAKRINDLVEASTPKVKFSELPLTAAIKIVKGNGKRTLVAFEDPNCGYCKRLEKSFDGLNDVTLYVFLYPILGDDSVAKSKAIWCSSDRAKAWQDWMHNGTPLNGSTNCENPVEQNVALGQKLAVTATPTMLFASGKRVPGAVGIDEVTKQLAVQ
jgi:thiol:disulfide interchange protein DsbC